LADCMPREFPDAATDASRAGERNQVDSRMGHELLAYLGAQARDQVENSWRNARRVHCLGKHKGIDRRNLGWLEYDGTPCGQGSSDLERDLAERKIPWRYGCNNASGFSDD